MVKFLVRRIIFLIFTLFFVSIAIFVISELAPGNIAVNTLGNTITPEQEASFNAQNGLDQPALIRYMRWMIGSDRQAEQLIDRPVIRIYDTENDRYSWWAVAENGTLFQNYTPDGETLFRVERQPDGSTQEVVTSDDVWRPNEDGLLIYWGVDQDGHAAMWVKGDDQQTWTLTKATWTSMAGAPRQYIPLQYGLLRGDPGVSFFTRRPVAETLVRRLFNTLTLAAIAFVIVMPLALLLGLMAGLKEGRFIDRFLSINSLVATATPEFASGIFLILIFATWLKLVPGAVVVSNDAAIFENPSMLVLPVLTLTLIELGYVLRITRASMVEVMKTNYIRTAILKGLPHRQIVFKHAVRNALMAPITIIMLHVNWLIGGIVVVEALFGFPGLGRYILEAALFKDVFAIEAAAMVLVIIAVATQLIADIIYTYLNPRIRYA
ncbi:MAG TPA: ABC transporter permease [Anaerolineae bacterium]|nr:ABC transporter permease [Anaerolineae bacterium]HXV98191.1 ABC transporter permease [Anaerolineae bacterium]